MGEHKEEKDREQKISLNPKVEAQNEESDLEESEQESDGFDETENNEGDDWDICPVTLEPIIGNAWVTNWGFTYSEEAKAGLPVGARDPMNQRAITSWSRNIKFEHARDRNNKQKKELEDSKQEALALRHVLDRQENKNIRFIDTSCEAGLLAKFLNNGKVELTELLLRGVTRLELLKSFNLGWDLPGCVTLVEALSKRTDFQEISLVGLQYNAASLDKFCLMLKNNRNLESLYLDSLGATNKISEALRGHPKLTDLTLPLVNSDQEVDAIVELLEANLGLERLNIATSEKLSDKRVGKLAAAIANHPGLRYVHLEHPQWFCCTEKGAKLYLNALRQNDRLIEFKLAQGHSKEILDAVEACLESNREKARKKAVKEEKTSGKRKREEVSSSNSSSSSTTTTTSEPLNSEATTSSVYSGYGSMYSASTVPKAEGEKERQVKKGKQEKGEEREQESPNPVVPRLVRGIQKN